MSIAKSQKPSAHASMAKGKKRQRRRTHPHHPAKALAASVYAGLAALFRLASRRVTDQREVQEFYARIERLWRDARIDYNRLKRAGSPDFTSILAIEHNMRKNYLGMLWWTTKPYGNTEFKRIYNWREGTIGPLNELLNYAGAQLRNVASTFFAFPKPTFFHVREYADGTRKMLHRSTAMRYPPKDAVRAFWIVAYPGNSRYPTVRVRHPTLPELDFVDMIRAHVNELVRQCFIHNVPRIAAQRYIRLLIHRLRPYLEWVYVGGPSHKKGPSSDPGRKIFWPEADQILREIVLELRAIYGRRIGRSPRMSQHFEYDAPLKVTRKIFEKQAKEAYERDPSGEMQKAVRSLTDLLKKEYLTDNDAEVFLDEILTISQKEGNDWHKILFSGMYHPNSLKQAVFAGDKFLTELTDVLIAAEVPVVSSRGVGQADLVVFVRRRVADTTVWTPVMVLDVKTKTGIDWGILGKLPRTNKEKTRVPLLRLRKRRLADDEWDAVIKSSPSGRNSRQLEGYANALKKAYKELVRDDSSALKDLWRGVVVLDTDQDRELLFTILPWLIKSILPELKTKSFSSRMLFTPSLPGVIKKLQPRLGVVLETSKGSVDLLKETVGSEHLAEENPFSGRRKDKRVFTLYLSVTSPGSSGESAAWIARNWHLLHYLKELKSISERPTELTWLDLTGDFGDELRNQHLRLLGSQKPRRISRRHLDGLRALVKEIDFQDLSEEIQEYFFRDLIESRQQLRSCLREAFRKDSKKHRIVIVDGWAALRQIVPSHLNPLFRALEFSLLNELPTDDVEVIWLDRPVPMPVMSPVYQRFKVTPLPHDSPRREHIDQIIWNLPSSPRNFGWKTPRREDIRLIVQDTPTLVAPDVRPFGVPHLKGWARRFRVDSSNDRTVSGREVLEDASRETYSRILHSSSDFVEVGSESMEVMMTDIFDLVPSLCRSRGYEKGDSPELRSADDISPELMLKVKKLGQVRAMKGIFDRVSFQSDCDWPQKGRKGTYSSPRGITRGRIRRRATEERKVTGTSRKPPILEETARESFDTEKTRRAEIIRVQKTAEFLKRQFESHEFDLQRFLNQVIKTCKKHVIDHAPVNTILAEIRGLLETHKVSGDTWKTVLFERIAHMRDEVTRISQSPRGLTQDDDVLLLYGNALFLLVLGVVKRSMVEEWTHLAEILWKAVAEWQLVHMGVNPRNSKTTLCSKYDTHALWSNLLWRMGWLISAPMRPHVFETIQTGQIIITERNEHWLVFQAKPGEDRIVAGMIEDVPPNAPPRGFYNGTVNLQILGEKAEEILQLGGVTRIPIVITRVENMSLLWMPYDEPEFEHEWSLVGSLRYGHPKNGQLGPIRWFNVSGVPRKLISRLTYPEVSFKEVDFTKRANTALQRIAHLGQKAESVQVEVSVSEASETYEVHLLDRGNEILETLETEETGKVVALLKQSHLIGNSQGPDAGVEYAWEPRKDIRYKEVDTKSGPLSTSFLKPLVHRRSFLNGKFTVPKTARQALLSRLGEEILMVASPDTDRYRKGRKRCWNVWFLEVDLGKRLMSVEADLLTVFDVALLFECEQIVDVDTGKRHPTRIVVNKTDEVSFPKEIHRYQRITSYLKSKIAHQGIAELD